MSQPIQIGKAITGKSNAGAIACFPRGGTTTSNEKNPHQAKIKDSEDSKRTDKRKHSETTNTNDDVLFGKKRHQSSATTDNAQNKRGKKKTSRKETTTSSLVSQDSEGPTTAGTISFKTLKKGTKLLGCVSKILPTELLISLPNQLTGRVSRSESSDYCNDDRDRHADENEEPASSSLILSSLFKIGQFVPCKVLSAERNERGKKEIQLTLRCSKVNQGISASDVIKGSTGFGTVHSIEDHGAIVNLGIKGLNGFVPNQDLTDTPLTCGQVFFFTVMHINAHTSTLTLRPGTSVIKSVTRGDHYSIKSLSPGMLLNVRVKKLLSNGLVVNFLQYFDATVNQNHLSSANHASWSRGFDECATKKITSRARIVAINVAEKTILCSMAPHIVHMSSPERVFDIGQIVPNAVVHRIDRGIGMTVSLLGCPVVDDIESDSASMLKWKDFQSAYVHISRTSDTRMEKLESKFSVGQVIDECRVLHFCPFDGVYQITLKPSTIAQSVIRIADLELGQRVRCEIVTIQVNAVLVSFGEGLRGLIPSLHLPLKGKKVKLGKKLDARVWELDVERNRVVLTTKKALCHNDLPPLCTFEQAQAHQLAMGIVTKIMPETGIIVSCYGHVFGLVPVGDIPDLEAYVVGQVVKICVVKVDLARQRMICSFDLSLTTSGQISTEALAQTQALAIGAFVDGKVVEKEEGFLRIVTPDGMIGNLPLSHLTDMAWSHAKAPSSSSDDIIPKVGSTLENLKVIHKRSDGLLTLTKKPMLCHLPQDDVVFPSSFEEISTGMKVIGFVASVDKTLGAFIQFQDLLHALVPLSCMSTEFVSDPTQVLEEGQTVIGVVEQIKMEKQQFVINLKSCTSFSSQYIQQSLQLRKSASSAHVLGSIHKAEFVAEREYGQVMKLSKDPDTMVILPKTSTRAEQQRVQLLDLDVDKQVLYGITSTKKSTSTKSFAKATQVQVVIQLLRHDYAIVSIEKTNVVGILQIQDFHLPCHSCESLHLKIGQTLMATIDQVPSESSSTFVYNSMYWLFCPSFDDSTKKHQTSKSSSTSGLPFYTMSDLVHGAAVEGKITAIRQEMMDIQLNTKHRVVARISIVDVPLLSSRTEHPFAAYAKDQVISAKILSRVDHVFDLTLKPDATRTSKTDVHWHSSNHDWTDRHDPWTGVITDMNATGMWIQLNASLRGFCHCLDFGWTNDLMKIKAFQEHFNIGQVLTESVYIVSMDADKRHLNLSLVRESPALVPGQVTLAMLHPNLQSYNAPALTVCLSEHRLARVCITEIAPMTEWTNCPLDALTYGSLCEVLVIATPPSSNDDGHDHDHAKERRMECSLNLQRRRSLSDESTLPTVGDIVQGFVKRVSKNGAFIRLSRQVEARVLLRDLADTFLKDPETQFPIGTLVAGRVLRVKDGRVELTLKPSLVTGDNSSSKFHLGNLEAGMHVKGTIASIKAYGVFVKIEDSRLSGLCHVSEMTNDPKLRNTEGVYAVGDYVKARVLKLDGTRIALGLKPSYFENDDSSESEESESEESEDEAEVAPEQVLTATTTTTIAATVSSESSESENEPDEEEMEDIKCEKQDSVTTSPMEWTATTKPKLSTSRSSSVAWDGFNIMNDGQQTSKTAEESSSEDDSDDDDDAENTKVSKTRKKNKITELKRDEEYIREREIQLMKGEVGPETNGDFERLLTASPNDSYLWIQYITFQISLTEIDMARSTAQRALSTIHFRQEQEKLNIWIAYLNLEAQHGNESTLADVFERAIQHSNPKKMYAHLLELYVAAKKWTQVDTTLEVVFKKFKTSRKIWLTGIHYYLVHQQNPQEASVLLQRSLKSLARHKHLRIISKFGQLEFEFGSSERGRTIFEGILSNYPKRMDLWNIYIDKEIKYGQEQDSVRRLFERVVHMKFSAHKIKAWFKKYIKYETQYGSSTSVQHVKDLIQQFVDSSSSV